MCGVVDGGIAAGLWGYEAGQSGVGDIFDWFVTTQVPHAYAAESAERGHLRARAAHRDGRRRRPSASTASSPSTGTAATARCWSTTSCRAGRRPDPGHPPRGHLPRPARVDGVRHPDDRGDLPGSGVPVTELVVAGGLLKNALLMQIYADVLGPAAVDHRLAAGPGPRLGDPRGGRRRRLPRRAPPPPARWAGSTAASTSPIAGQRGGVRRAVRRVPRASTTTSAAAATTSCCASRRSAAGRCDVMTSDACTTRSPTCARRSPRCTPS